MSVSSRIDPALLFTFLAVVDAQKISAAARSLRLSQPAVTAQIRRLEEAIGAPLFMRSSQGVSPSPLGLRLVPYARRIQQLVAEAGSLVGDDHEAEGELVLAASTTIAGYVAPPLLASFRAANPKVSLRMEVGNTEHVVRRVVEGAVPFGLVEGHARAPNLRLETLVDDEILPAIGRSAPFRVRSLGDLQGVPILWREHGSGTRAVVERALRERGVRQRPLPLDVELGSTAAIKGAIVAGLGIGFLSRWAMRSELASGSIVVVPRLDFVIERTFRWALPAGGLHGTAARFFALAQRTPLIF